MRIKKVLILISAVTVLTALLLGCNFNTNFNDSMGLTQMEATPQVEAALDALTAADTQAALNLMHPDVAESSHAGITQMAEYLEGREVTGLEQVNLHVTNSAGTAGKVRQEQAVFLVNLSDSTQVHISVVHVTSGSGEGFVSFQLILGVV